MSTGTIGAGAVCGVTNSRALHNPAFPFIRTNFTCVALTTAYFWGTVS